jgi:hypothetical protein
MQTLSPPHTPSSPAQPAEPLRRTQCGHLDGDCYSLSPALCLVASAISWSEFPQSHQASACPSARFSMFHPEEACWDPRGVLELHAHQAPSSHPGSRIFIHVPFIVCGSHKPYTPRDKDYLCFFSVGYWCLPQSLLPHIRGLVCV